MVCMRGGPHLTCPPGSLAAWALRPNAGQSQSRSQPCPSHLEDLRHTRRGEMEHSLPFLLIPAGACPHQASCRGAGRRSLETGQWLDLLLAGNVPGSRIGEKHGRSGNLPPPPPPPTAHRPPPSEAVDRRWRETDRFKDDLDPHLCLHFGQVEGCACCMWGVVSRGEKPQGREGRSLLRRSPRRKQKTNG